MRKGLKQTNFSKTLIMELRRVHSRKAGMLFREAAVFLDGIARQKAKTRSFIDGERQMQVEELFHFFMDMSLPEK